MRSFHQRYYLEADARGQEAAATSKHVNSSGIQPFQSGMVSLWNGFTKLKENQNKPTSKHVRSNKLIQAAFLILNGFSKLHFGTNFEQRAYFKPRSLFLSVEFFFRKYFSQSNFSFGCSPKGSNLEIPSCHFIKEEMTFSPILLQLFHHVFPLLSSCSSSSLGIAVSILVLR